MPKKKLTVMELTLISVPTELLNEADIHAGSMVQMSVADGRLIIEAVDDTADFVCDGDCEGCPVSETDCDGDCGTCPCCEYCDESEVF